MDRISALRNVEEALREFERGEADLAATERRVAAVLRTYATEFGEGRDDLAAFRAAGEDPADGVVVVAPSPPRARERVLDLLGADAGDDEPTFDVERLD